MKQSIRNIMMLAILAVILVTAYQAYWLTDIYATLQHNLQKDIAEAMRASDFAEITRRVELLRNQGIGGKMDITVGADSHGEQVEVGNEYQSPQERDRLHCKQRDSSVLANRSSKGSPNSSQPFADFASALSDEEAVRRVGLYMQRGIHDGLDRLMPVQVTYYDSILSRRLDSLGVTRRHASLYICRRQGRDSVMKVMGKADIAEADTFKLDLNSAADRQYLLLIERHLFSLPKQMHSALLFSAFTLLLLILCFAYLINMIRRMKALDEMKSDFTNNITHELKTPIAVAYAVNDALLNFSGRNNPEKLHKYLTICQEQLTLLTQLMEQILSLSMERRKNMKLNFEEVELLPVIEKLVDNHRLKASRHIDIMIEANAGISVWADRIHLSNVLNNLIDNAIKYSPNEVSIRIEAYVLHDGRKEVKVTDRGMGIAKEQQQFIFDKFYRVPHGNLHQVKGYGLGLFYVRSMMERFGGSVVVKSEENVGSCFKLTWPATPSS